MADEWTSVTIRSDTKDDLDRAREESESWDAFFRRWLDDEPPRSPSTDRILEAIDQIPEQTASEIESRLR